MRSTKIVRPEYADRFRCIGPTCEDSCCAGWAVTIDKATYQKYQSIPPGPLRVLMDTHIAHSPEDPGGKNPSAFAQVKLLPSRECPFHNAERLCQIQVELGEEYLSHTCATYPRRSYVIDKLIDKTLTTSCPEACRLVLLNPDLLEADWTGERHIKWDESKHDPTLVSYFWPIREFVIGLIRDRTYPLWQRMFLLGTFSRRLEAVIRGDITGGFPAMLEGFSAAVASGGLRTSIETIPADLTLQLGMVLELVRLGSHPSPRLVESIDAFGRGIEYGPESTLPSMSAAYGAAYERYFAPFVAERPYILENYLINMIFNRLFPFGDKALVGAAAPEPAKEFALLATNFALVKGLLIGVAGAHMENFSTEHVVLTVQSASKYFEHNLEFLSKVHQILVDKGIANAHGLTMLIRN
jgi:lysine-N-methylase